MTKPIKPDTPPADPSDLLDVTRVMVDERVLRFMEEQSIQPELPDGSTLGDWVAMARAVHGLDEEDD